MNKLSCSYRLQPVPTFEEERVAFLTGSNVPVAPRALTSLRRHTAAVLSCLRVAPTKNIGWRSATRKTLRKRRGCGRERERRGEKGRKYFASEKRQQCALRLTSNEGERRRRRDENIALHSFRFSTSLAMCAVLLQRLEWNSPL